MTYESASEADVLKSFWRPGAPLENTVFAILDPSGRPIIRGGRSPKWVFRDSADMARTMNEIAQHYDGNARAPDGLPSVANVRLALDVAACDKRPLAIVVAKTANERARLSQMLAKIAWSEKFIGKLIYTQSEGDDLNSVKGANSTSGYIFVSPNLFGTTGSVLSQVPATASQADLERFAQQAIVRHHPEILSHHDHVRMGHMSGIEWQTAIPVTDPHSPPKRPRW